ncbi:hypothetical protein [Methanobrevibacter sp.]
MKLCPDCGAELAEVIGGYLCHECGGGMYGEEEVIIPKCPFCDEELGSLGGDDFYCFYCNRTVERDEAVYSKEMPIDDDNSFNESDYDSMVNNGDNICLNCTYWSTSPYGASYGMICRRGYQTDGPGDSCSDFVQSSSFANYGDGGQYQFDETSRNISNKLHHWKNNR